MIKTQEQLATLSSPRSDARVTLPDGRVFSAPVGTSLLAYMEAAFPPGHPDRPIVGAIVDNRLTELVGPVQRDVTVLPVNLRHSDGARIYRRSLVFLLACAVEEIWPEVKIAVQHTIPSGGFYCEVVGRPNFSKTELRHIQERMEQIVAEDAPIVRKTIPLAEAVELFSASGDDDKVRLLESRDKDYLTVYTLRNNVDYFFGYMVPSTGSLRLFDLLSTADGFIMRFPRQEEPDKLQPYKKSIQLESIFRQTDEWLQVMGVEDVGRLNQAITRGRLREEVLVAEALHSRYIAEIARVIAQQHARGMRLVLIAGPSSSGKTTFSKRLAVQLMAYGIQPFTLAMDNYFVDRDQTPKDENGDFDFESLRALNLERFNADLLALMQQNEVQLPRFDFKLGKGLPGEVVRLSNEHIIIAEGIHGLNPELVSQIPIERIFRIYVSALTALNLDRHNRIPTTDVRLLRRMVRDATHRGYSAFDTLQRWESVRRGEKRNIFPYQENADVMFNSSLAYELSVIRPLAEPLLRQVEPESGRYIEAKRLLAFLRWVRPTTPEFVPDDSLLREFVGGSILDTFSPGDRQNGARNGNGQH